MKSKEVSFYQETGTIIGLTVLTFVAGIFAGRATK
jgi:hypothetical protein